MSPLASNTVQRVLSLALGLAVLGVAAWLSTRHTVQADWTAGNRNTLTAASRQLLASMPGPIQITAYMFPDADVRQEIEARVAPYQRERGDIGLNFVDPARDPQAVRDVGIGQSGEVVISYQGRSENLRAISEATISAALQRLAFAGEAQIRFLLGHGERDPRDTEQGGLSSLAATLNEKGLRVDSFNFAASASIPADTDVLVLAAPQRELLAGELARVVDYVEAGGKLLWLYDPDVPPLPALAAALQLEQQFGTVIYQDYELLGIGHPGLALVAEYSGHAITREMVDLTVFPLSAGVRAAPSEQWFTSPLATSPPRSWLETGELNDKLIFDEPADTDGPIQIGLALTRFIEPPASSEHADQPPPDRIEQRVVVFADSDFLSNAFISQVGNRRLGINIMQWLASRDAQINIDVPVAPDVSLNLSPAQTLVIALGFVVILPGGLLGIGILRWWTRRRRRQ